MRMLISLAALVAAGALTGGALAADPIVTPFPSAQVGEVVVTGQTVGTDGVAANYFAPGSTVVFRVAAVDGKTHKFVGAKDAKYFYVEIAGQPNLKLVYDPKAPAGSAALPWIASWKVPADYQLGTVNFKVLIKTQAKRHGMFVQLPITSAQLTIAAKPPVVPTATVAAPGTVADKLDVSLYVDSVNGTRPAAAAPRPIGCTQTNVFARGEQFVLRTWGVVMAGGEVLSTDNVDSAYVVIPGQPNLTLNWGAHGTTANRVWFWSNAWNIPKDYPLGEAVLKVTFKTDDGKTGVFDYPITIIP